jgi:cysteine-rich repeat protein/probable HAF family extracellular repeat protein
MPILNSNCPRWKPRVLGLACAAGVAAGAQLAPQPAVAASFRGLGDLAGGATESIAHDISDDGTTVVGSSQSTSGNQAFRWKAGTLTGLGDLSGGQFSSEAFGVSQDGSIVVGDSSVGNPDVHAFRWQNNSLTDLGSGFLAGAFDVSASGSRAVGVHTNGSTSSPQPNAARWDGTTLTDLGDLSGGAINSSASAVSADGSIIVGSADNGSGQPVGFRWQSSTMTALTSIAPGYTTLLANGVSADGGTIVGEDNDPSLGLRAFRLQGSTVTILSGMRRALDASADGSVVVGSTGTGSSTQATIWTAAGGVRRLVDVLTQDYNLSGFAGWTLREAVAISNNGLAIAGNGINPSGQTEAWLVELTPGCSDGLDNDGDSLVDMADPGCSSPSDISEKSPSLPCDDFQDDDGDGFADYPADPGCSSPTDTSENTPSLVCDDGLDNDGDGAVDVAADPGCTSVSDSSERDPSLVCDDGVDNDGDTLIDHPADPDCTSPFDPSEQSIAGAAVGEAKISATAGGFGGALADGDLLGSAIAGPGDLDGNGVADLVVGAPGGPSAAHAGHLWTLLLAADGSVLSETQLDPSISGPLDPGDHVGQALAALGDFDGNTVPDVAAGAPRDDDGGTDRGAVWTLLLGAGGGLAGNSKISSTAGGFAGPLPNGGQFGGAVASIGDLDGNGTPDLAVGAPGDSDAGLGKGAVWVLRRAPGGGVVSAQKISATQGGFGGTLDFFDFFGSSVASLGDLNGDGVVDLAVGAPFDDDGGGDRGAVWILFLASNGTVSSWQKISATAGGFAGPLATGDEFGASVAALGDLDADGVVDLAVGAPFDDDGGPDRGAVWILLLNPNGTVKAEQKIDSVQGGLAGPLGDGDEFGAAVASVGDIDGDGGGELAVGAPLANDGGADRGAVYLLRLDRAICGDGTAEFGEACDDGNLQNFDGCSATCALQDGFTLTGTAQGGSVSLVISGVTIVVGTVHGQSAAVVLAALAQKINTNPTLSALGVTASVQGDLLVVDGATITLSQIHDPGFAPFVPPVPALSSGGRGLLAGLLLAGGLAAALRGRARRDGQDVRCAEAAPAARLGPPAHSQAPTGETSSNQWRVRLQKAHTESMTGTSTRTPTTVARAAPEPGP